MLRRSPRCTQGNSSTSPEEANATARPDKGPRVGGSRCGTAESDALSSRIGEGSPVPVAKTRNRHDDEGEIDPMTKYLISFPGAAMVFPDEDLQAVSDALQAVVQEARDAGVWVFGGGIDESIPPVMVDGDGTVTEGTYT